MQTALDERMRFARTRSGHDEHVAARGDGLPLGRRQAVIVFWERRFHAGGNLATDEHGVKPRGGHAAIRG
jgi:hypothetical protein